MQGSSQVRVLGKFCKHQVFSAAGRSELGRAGNELEEMRPELDQKWSDASTTRGGGRQREAGKGSVLP